MSHSGPAELQTSGFDLVLHPEVGADGLVYIFGYASLVNYDDAQRTLQGPPPFGPWPAVANGIQRSWCVGAYPLRNPFHYPAYPAGHELEGKPYTGLLGYLGLQRREGATCAGAVMGVTPAQFDALRARELNYFTGELTDGVAGVDLPKGAKIYTFVPKDQALQVFVDPPDGLQVVVRKGYYKIVEDAMSAAGLLEAFRRDTPEPSVPIVDLERILLPAAEKAIQRTDGDVVGRPGVGLGLRKSA